jgi:hypothetical protein
LPTNSAGRHSRQILDGGAVEVQVLGLAVALRPVLFLQRLDPHMVVVVAHNINDLVHHDPGTHKGVEECPRIWIGFLRCGLGQIHHIADEDEFFDAVLELLAAAGQLPYLRRRYVEHIEGVTAVEEYTVGLTKMQVRHREYSELLHCGHPPSH